MLKSSRAALEVAVLLAVLLGLPSGTWADDSPGKAYYDAYAKYRTESQRLKNASPAERDQVLKPLQADMDSSLTKATRQDNNTMNHAINRAMLLSGPDQEFIEHPARKPLAKTNSAKPSLHPSQHKHKGHTNPPKPSKLAAMLDALKDKKGLKLPPTAKADGKPAGGPVSLRPEASARNKSLGKVEASGAKAVNFGTDTDDEAEDAKSQVTGDQSPGGGATLTPSLGAPAAAPAPKH